MAMSLGPVTIEIDLETSADLTEVQEIVHNLYLERKKLTPGSDASIILAMIAGYLDGRLQGKKE